MGASAPPSHEHLKSAHCGKTDTDKDKSEIVPPIFQLFPRPIGIIMGYKEQEAQRYKGRLQPKPCQFDG